MSVLVRISDIVRHKQTRAPQQSTPPLLQEMFASHCRGLNGWAHNHHSPQPVPSFLPH
jgi:hypothetical protein